MKNLKILLNQLEDFIRQHRWLLGQIGKFVCFGITIWLLLSVFFKVDSNMPVILRTNDFGFNFLTHRNVIWLILLLETIFLVINIVLARWFQNNYKVLSFWLKFVNIEIIILCLLISCQIYFLNL